MSTDLERRLRELLEEKQADVVVPGDVPTEIVRRARRRSGWTIALTTVATVTVLATVLATSLIIAHRRPGTPATQPGPTGDTTATTDRSWSPGPAPGESSLELAHGVDEGEPWSLAVTRDQGGQLTLSFGYTNHGSGGGGLDPMRGDRLFQSYGGSNQLEYPNDDRSRPPLHLAISGQTRADVARIEFEENDGPVIDGSVYALPPDLVGPARAFLVLVPGDTLVVAGQLVAYDASGTELGRVTYDVSPVGIYPGVLEQATPDALEVMRQLQIAGAVVSRYYDEHGSYSGLTPETAAAISDDVTYNTSDAAIAGEISLRVAGPDALVLAGRTSSGDVYSACLSMNGGVVEGRNDTSDPSACTNGWLNPDASPVEDTSPQIATGDDGNGNLWRLSILDVGSEVDLELALGPITTDLPLEPLGDRALGSVAGVPPNATPVGVTPSPTLPSAIDGIASGDVARVEFRSDGGSTFQGELSDVPSGFTEAAQAYVILIPTARPISGDVVALDASGNELDRRHVDIQPMP